MYFVYIIECSDRSLYTGITNNLERRFSQHKAGVAAHYTSARKPKRFVFTEEHPNRSSALKREAQIKKLKRTQKLELIRID